MALSHDTNTHFFCLNADVASLPALGADFTGASALAVDTGRTYLYDGVSTWTIQPGPAATVISQGKALKTVSGTLTADTDVIAAVTAKRIKVYAYSLITTGVNANARIFKSNGTAGTELWRVILQAPAASSVFGANLAVSPPAWLFATVAGEKLTLDVGDTDAIHYSIAYFDDDAT